MLLRVCLAFLIAATTLVAPAKAIINGEIATGSDYVVTLLVGEKNPQGYCTGAYLRPRVVVTAAHCVIKAGAKAPEPAVAPNAFFVSQAGVDWTTPEAKESRVKVLKFWTTPEYYNRWEPEKGLIETQVDDIAFLFLEKELTGVPLSRAATREEIEEYRLGVQGAFHLGYGCINNSNNKVVGNDGKPRLVEGIVGSQRQVAHIPIKDRFLSVTYPSGKSLCPGDSGSPLMMKKGNEVLYLATLFAGGGWNVITEGNPAHRGDAAATVLWPFIPTLDAEWEKFLVEEKEIKAAEAAKKLEAERAAQKLMEVRAVAVSNNTFYKDKSACHARGINAELQELNQGIWKSAASTLGWDEEPGCPVTHPVQPWTVAEIPHGATLRWRFWIPGQFDVNSPQFTALLKVLPTPSPTPSPAPVVMPSPSATPTPVTKPTVTPQNEIKVLAKTTITCVKGKLTKKVKAVNPKCPKGYKKK